MPMNNLLYILIGTLTFIVYLNTGTKFIIYSFTELIGIMNRNFHIK